MPLFPSLAFGIRLLQDTSLRVSNPGQDTFLRVKKFPTDDQAVKHEGVELGFRIPTDVAKEPTFTDIPVDPPAEVTPVSSNSIARSAGRLMAGAMSFKISHTFVLNAYAEGKLSFVNDVFNAKDYVVGILYSDQLYSIDSVEFEQTGGEILYWMIKGNTVQKKVT